MEVKWVLEATERLGNGQKVKCIELVEEMKSKGRGKGWETKGLE